MKNSVPIRAGPDWLAMEEEFRKHGVRFTRPQLTDGIGRFIREQNFVPMLANKARKNQGRRLFS